MRSFLHRYAVQADGAELDDRRGARAAGRAHPLQQAFHERHGLQCGYCTPGFLMTAYELLGSGKVRATRRSARRSRGTSAAAPATRASSRRSCSPTSAGCADERVPLLSRRSPSRRPPRRLHRRWARSRDVPADSPRGDRSSRRRRSSRDRSATPCPRLELAHHTAAAPMICVSDEPWEPMETVATTAFVAASGARTPTWPLVAAGRSRASPASSARATTSAMSMVATTSFVAASICQMNAPVPTAVRAGGCARHPDGVVTSPETAATLGRPRGGDHPRLEGSTRSKALLSIAFAVIQRVSPPTATPRGLPVPRLYARQKP